MVSANQPSEPTREIRSALGDQISGHYPSRPDAPSTRITRKVMIGSSIALTGPSSPIGAVLTWSGSANRSRAKMREFRERENWGRPVPGFGDLQAQLLIIRLDPTVHGANGTGGMFSRDGLDRWASLPNPPRDG